MAMSEWDLKKDGRTFYQRTWNQQDAKRYKNNYLLSKKWIKLDKIIYLNLNE